jgi:hypothetical protein
MIVRTSVCEAAFGARYRLQVFETDDRYVGTLTFSSPELCEEVRHLLERGVSMQEWADMLSSLHELRADLETRPRAADDGAE